MINILLILIGCVFGCLGIYYYLRPRLNTITEYNNDIDKENAALAELNAHLSQKNNELSQTCSQATAKLNSLNEGIKTATEQFKSLSASLEETANSMYEQSRQMAESKMQATHLLLQKQYDEQKQQLETDYELKKNEIAEKKSALQQNIEKAENHLAELTAKVQGALEAARRQEELESNLDFYRIILSEEDEIEIKAFDSIKHLISNRRNLLMFLWTNYYSKKVNELAARVLGATAVCGIYKITNTQTQQVYIGQAVDVRDRWRTHCKFALGIDTPNTNRLYQNMQKYGLSNFTFELMQKCSREELDAREKHWISFYQSNTLGLNSTSGNGK